MKETDYVTVHNLIYGAIEFAEEAGCSPDKSFNITRYILSPDTEDIPLVQFDFGKDGKHLLIANSRNDGPKSSGGSAICWYSTGRTSPKGYVATAHLQDCSCTVL